ncbi:hypothetical protein [Spiroplasma endosymbiont of Zeiraphera isertana]
MLLKSKTFIHPEKKFLLIQVIEVYKIFIKIHFCHLKKVNTIN